MKGTTLKIPKKKKNVKNKMKEMVLGDKKSDLTQARVKSKF